MYCVLLAILFSVNIIKITFRKCKSFCFTGCGSFVSHGRPCITLRMLTGYLCQYRVKMSAENFLLDLLLIFTFLNNINLEDLCTD